MCTDSTWASLSVARFKETKRGRDVWDYLRPHSRHLFESRCTSFGFYADTVNQLVSSYDTARSFSFESELRSLIILLQLLIAAPTEWFVTSLSSRCRSCVLTIESYQLSRFADNRLYYHGLGTFGSVSLIGPLQWDLKLSGHIFVSCYHLLDKQIELGFVILLNLVKTPLNASFGEAMCIHE